MPANRTATTGYQRETPLPDHLENTLCKRTPHRAGSGSAPPVCRRIRRNRRTPDSDCRHRERAGQPPPAYSPE